MAAGNTTDIRTHVLGDLLMVTGTFTDGGIDVFYGDHLTTVLAAGGFATSNFASGVTINNGGGYAAGTATALTVTGIDCRLQWTIGDTLYTAAGARLGTITAIGGATSITVGGGLLAAVAHTDPLHKTGPLNAAITLTNGTLDVAVDITNKYVVFCTGNEGAASDASTLDGGWWILGKR